MTVNRAAQRPSAAKMVRRHLGDMLKELADLADGPGDATLSQIALSLRALALETRTPLTPRSIH